MGKPDSNPGLILNSIQASLWPYCLTTFIHSANIWVPHYVSGTSTRDASVNKIDTGPHAA